MTTITELLRFFNVRLVAPLAAALKSSVVVLARYCVVICATICTSLAANAAITLSTLEDNVPVYTGPSERFRLLAVLPAKTELKAANQIVSSDAGRFYRVIVKLGENMRGVGFIPVNAPVKVGGEDEDEDDLSKFGPVALISRAAQVAFGNFQDKQSMWTAGYMHYLSPGFYAKGMAGQWITPTTNASLLGGEIGNDSLLFRSTSGFVSYGLGLLSPGNDNTLFAGSAKLNIFMNATLGLRYNIEGFASVAVAGSQVAFYNQNNSMVSNGIQLSLEVGL